MTSFVAIPPSGFPQRSGGPPRSLFEPLRQLPPEGQTEKIELLASALNRPVVLAYGRHIVGGNVIFEQTNTDGSAALFVALGEGEWDSAERIWVNGLEIDLADTGSFHLHPGLDGQLGRETSPATRNQKICSFTPSTFSPQLTFSRTAYAAFRLLPDPTAPGPGFHIVGIYKTLRVRSFDDAGAQTAYAYSFNPAWVALDLLLRRFLFPHGLAGEALPTSVKNRIDFAAWKDWADFCDTDLTINGQVVNRFEAHPAFVESTDLLRALEWVLLLGRGYLLERNGKFAAFPDKARSSLLTLGRDQIASDTLQLARRSLRTAANQFLFRYRALDSGAACNDPGQDFQPQLKEVADEDHQDQVGRIVRAEIDLGNATGERAERLAEHLKRRTLDLTKEIRCRVLADTPGVIDLLPGDLITAPADLDYTTTQDYEILEISDEPDGSRELRALEYSASVFVDTAGPQQQVVDCPDPGGGIASNAPRHGNALQNGSFFRAGVGGQEGADRPKFWQVYSNAAGSPAVPADIEHLVDDDRVTLKTKTSTVDKIGLRTLWKNLGRLYKPGFYVALAVSLRHTGSGGTYDKDIKLKLDSDAENYQRADSTKFEATLAAGTIGNTFEIVAVTFQLRGDIAVPNALNAFLWSEATNASKSNEDLEIDWMTLAVGRVWRPFDPMTEVRDADITWDSGTGLYSLPGYLVKDTASSQDSGGAGGSSGGGSSGGIGCVLEGTEIVPLTHAMRVTSEVNRDWVEIELADGRRLTATPDHPIYTDRGKTPLRLVEVGEGVVTDKGIVAAARIAPLQRPGRKLVVSMQRGHLFWANGVLSHNLKPLV